MIFALESRQIFLKVAKSFYMNFSNDGPEFIFI